MRVLQIVPSFGIGGAERVSAQLAVELQSAGLEVAVVSMYGPLGTVLESMLAERGIKVQYCGKRLGFDPRMFVRIWRALRSFRPDVIHTHMYSLPYTLPGVLATGGLTRWVHTVHSSAERERDRIGTSVPSMLFQHAVTAVATAREVQRGIRRVFGAESVFIPNSIPVEVYRTPKTKREEWRARAGFGGADLLFVNVARLDAIKGHRSLLESLAEAKGRAHLLLAGEGGLRNDLQALAQALGLTERVHFLGVRHDVPDVLGAADAFVFASQSETTPLSVMEAMAAGLPIVSTAVGDVPEIVHADTGLLVASGDVAALAGALARLEGDAALRRSMGTAARSYAERFDFAHMTRSYVDLYRKVVNL